MNNGCIFLTTTHRYNIIMNRSNDFSFENQCFLIVHYKSILKTINTQTVFDEIWYIIQYFIVNFFPFPNIFIGKTQDKNNIYTSCVNSTEPKVEPYFFHQLNMHTITLLCVIINPMYLHLPDLQWLCLYMIPQYWAYIASFFLDNQW